jgi:hypothetical protein
LIMIDKQRSKFILGHFDSVITESGNLVVNC